MELKDIVVQGRADGETGDGETLLWVWQATNNRYTQKFKYWANTYTDDTYSKMTGIPGWGDENMITTNFTFSVGDGFWLKPGVGGNTESKAPELIMAGEVVNPGNNTAYYTWELKKNKNYILTNPFPGEFELKDIVVYEKSSGATGDGETLLWFWDTATTRNTSKLRYWEDPYTDATFTTHVGKPGWGDENMVATNITFATAQGFWIKSGIGGTGSKAPMIRFTNPFYKAN